MNPAAALPAPATPSNARWLLASAALLAAGGALAVPFGSDKEVAGWVLFGLPPLEAVWLGLVLGQALDARLAGRGWGRLERGLARLGSGLAAALGCWALVMLQVTALAAARHLGGYADQLSPLLLAPPLLGAGAAVGVWAWRGLRGRGAGPGSASLQLAGLVLLYGLLAALVANPLAVILVGCLAPGQGNCSDF